MFITRIVLHSLLHANTKPTNSYIMHLNAVLKHGYN